MHFLSVIALSTLLAPPLAPPGSSASPSQGIVQVKTYTSADGRYRLLVIPGKPGETGSTAGAKLTGPDGETVTYPLANPVAPIDSLVLDEGVVLTFDEWKQVGRGAVAAAYGADGTPLWSRTLEELLPPEALARVPVGVGSRPWRTAPPELHAPAGDGKGLEVRARLWNADELALDPATGAVRYVEISDHGQDAQAWAASARDLNRLGRTKDAAREFERALAIDASLVRVWDELANVWRTAGELGKALEVLERGVAENPLGKKASDPLAQASQNTWLLFQLARAYDESGDGEKAQAAVLRCLEADPSMWVAVRLRALHLARTGATTELDALLARTYESMAGLLGGPNRPQRQTQAALLVGRFYRDQGRMEEARNFYRRALDGGVYEEALYVELAEVEERLGDRERAMELLAKVIEELLISQAQQTEDAARDTAARIAELEAEIERLDAESSRK